MKKNTNLILSNWKQVCVVVFAGLLICSVTVQSQPSLVGKDVRQTYYFAAPILETIDIAGILYDRVTLDDCYTAGSAGEPKIPSKGVFLLLPPDSLVSDIELITGEKVLLGSGYSIEPTSEAIHLSQTEDIPVPTPNEVLYNTNAAYPGVLFTQVGIQSFRGYQMVVLLLHPIQYNPVTGELFYYTSLEVSVKTVGRHDRDVLRRYRGGWTGPISRFYLISGVNICHQEGP